MGAHRFPPPRGGHSRGYVRGEVAPLTDCVPRRLPRVHRVPPGSAPRRPIYPIILSSKAPRRLHKPRVSSRGPRVACWGGRGARCPTHTAPPAHPAPRHARLAKAPRLPAFAGAQE